MRTETLTESSRIILKLTQAEARALQALGERLASQSTWWGQGEPDEEAGQRTVIAVEPHGGENWSVRVSDAVGVVAVGTLQLIVQPKIPMSQLLYLFHASGNFPRFAEQRAATGESASLWDLVAHWFVGEIEKLLRREVVRDYDEIADVTETVRGRLDAIPTARLYYSGRLEFAGEFDEFAFDTPLNRVLKAATAAVAGSAILEETLRRRAVRALARLDEIGSLRTKDLDAQLDRRTRHYFAPFSLGCHILRHAGRALAIGGEVAWSFLIRTPEMVEEGIRRVLARTLGSSRVSKHGRGCVGSSLTFTPDLVFDGGECVADVKYKTRLGGWTREDLYQIVAFAEAFGACDGAVIDFRPRDGARLPDALIGQKRIREIHWPISSDLEPEVAAAEMVEAVGKWLDESSRRKSQSLERSA